LNRANAVPNFFDKSALTHDEASRPSTIIFQSAKLGDVPQILSELAWAEQLLRDGVHAGRIYGTSGGALVALAFGLSLAAGQDPEKWGKARSALTDLQTFLRGARSRDIRALNLNPLYGCYNLNPLRRWIANRLQCYCGRDDVDLSDLGVPLYLCAIDWDGVFTLFGPHDDELQFQYHWVHVGPPRDAPIPDATIAALSTMLSTEPARVKTLAGPGEWFRDCRPAIVDAGAIVADLEARDSRPILRGKPHAPIRPWKLNWITSSFIMHSQGERNHVLLTAHYLDLLERQRALKAAYQELSCLAEKENVCADTASPAHLPLVGHIDLPYVGSTEASTNMRETVENKAALIARFQGLLEGQPARFSFDRPANVIYGAGGPSGILAGLTATRAVEASFERHGGEIRQIYGVSAGVLNGFFHAVQVAAARHPDLYTPAARNALDDLEAFLAHMHPSKIVRFNLNPLRFWQGWTNLGPLRAFLHNRLAAYTGTKYPEQITFDDIALPLTINVSRRDGFVDFLGMTAPDRRMQFAGHEWVVRSAEVVQAITAGWSMNTYIQPTVLDDQVYVDGGGTFYDPALFVACLDPELVNLLNIHLDDPEGHSYHLPPRPNLVRIVWDTHNYIFPEERRRMRALTDLLYEHYRLRTRYAALLRNVSKQGDNVPPLPPDFRREWQVDNWHT
jgi:predicted acylesterase/phospholipase RssA